MIQILGHLFKCRQMQAGHMYLSDLSSRCMFKKKTVPGCELSPECVVLWLEPDLRVRQSAFARSVSAALVSAIQAAVLLLHWQTLVSVLRTDPWLPHPNLLDQNPPSFSALCSPGHRGCWRIWDFIVIFWWNTHIVLSKYYSIVCKSCFSSHLKDQADFLKGNWGHKCGEGWLF